MKPPRFIPKDKMDLEACGLLESANDQDIQPYLPELIEWLADSNWPVAKPIIERLNTVGEELALPLIDVLNGDDAGWKYFILSGVMLTCRPEVRNLCMSEVIKLINAPSPYDLQEEVNLVALDVKTLFDKEPNNSPRMKE